MAAKPVRGAPSAKNNDRLWHCTNDEARGTVFVKGAARRSASTWPVPAAASAVGRPWSCTLPPELGLHMCGYLDAPSLARLEISRGLGDQAPRAWEAQAAGLDRGDLGDDVSAKRLVGMNVRTLNALATGTLFYPTRKFDAFVFSARVAWAQLDRDGRRRSGAITTATFHHMRLRPRTSRRVDVGRIEARSTFHLKPSSDAQGHAALMPMARQIFRETDRGRAQGLVRTLYPKVDLTCTRIADGATIKVFGCQMPRLCGDHELGAAPQIEGALAYRGRVAFDVKDFPRVYLTFDRSTGKLRAMCFSFELEVHNILADDDEPDALIEGRPMSNSTFCALLHAGLDESVRRAARGASQQSRP